MQLKPPANESRYWANERMEGRLEVGRSKQACTSGKGGCDSVGGCTSSRVRKVQPVTGMMSPHSKVTALATGANGYVACPVIEAFLAGDYNVRGTVRHCHPQNHSWMLFGTIRIN